MSRRRKFLIGVASLVGVGALVYALVGDPFDPFDNRRFESQAWSAASDEDRAGMSRDLVDHHLPAGMTEAQVVTLLGKPNSIHEGKTHAPTQVGSRDLMYRLGNFPMRGMDDAYVFVHLDESGHVVKAEVFGY